MIKIGIIKEGKVPVDRRVPVTPAQAKEIKDKFPIVDIVVQSSNIRCFSDDDYRNAGIEVVDSLDDCQVILGVKEVPIHELMSDKTYFFFSHTIKKQEYNRELLQAILKKNIQLIDYETLTDAESNRIIAFGRWAGIVGAYNAIWTFGRRYNLFNIRRAHECFDLEDLRTEFEKVKLPPIKIAITGGGRVAKGAMEVLHGMDILKVTPAVFLEQSFHEPVFTQLNSRDYHQKKDGTNFNRHEFFDNPSLYDGDFIKYANEADLLIASAYWDPRAPVLFKREDALKSDFRLRVIADITCDIEGSVPSTKQPTTIDDPIYDYNPSEDLIEKPLTDEANITVMAVDNLPCELPRDASESFGYELIHNVLPHFIRGDKEGIIKKATIAQNGRLTDKYDYLQDYIDE
ncbi:MAG: alanine dehydrogenase [Cyclobacteriaceae bacterium]|nr:alanine dehydrogenase [Cyclobacteriaceae bacterium HetDA_MAG_MS6]